MKAIDFGFKAIDGRRLDSVARVWRYKNLIITITITVLSGKAFRMLITRLEKKLLSRAEYTCILTSFISFDLSSFFYCIFRHPYVSMCGPTYCLQLSQSFSVLA